MVAFGIQHLLSALISFQLGAVVCGSPTLTSPAAVSAIRAPNFATESHPSSGTEPPSGAVLVSADGSIANSFTNLNDAIWSLPNDTSSQVIFIYPGTYVQQSKINRNGTVTVIGYQLGDVGKTYSGNQVTLSFKRGLSVATSIPGTSDSDTAVMYTSSTGISFYNVNFINTDNLDGAISSYVTLASATYGDHIAYYGCSFVGWQDTLLTGNRQGSSYYESSYIDGAIDFIWGYGLGYFKGCTIAAKRANGYFTAHNRLNATSHGAYVFDQCLFTKGNTTANLTASVSLGRPWSQYAKVIIKDSYLDDIIKPAGWSQWSTSSPNLDGVIFAEYNNVGPGNWENNAAAREAFVKATLLTEDTYKFADVVGNTTWIDLTYFDGIVTPTPA